MARRGARARARAARRGCADARLRSDASLLRNPAFPAATLDLRNDDDRKGNQSSTQADKMVTAMQKTLVQSSWGRIFPKGSTDDQYFAVGKLFFDRIFEVTPAAEGMFPFNGEDRASSVKFRAHATKVIKTVGVAVAGLDDLESLVPVLKQLGEAHVKYGVIAEHYDLIGAALLWTLEQGLGKEWGPSYLEAWSAVYGVVAATMKEGAGYEAKARMKRRMFVAKLAALAAVAVAGVAATSSTAETA